MTSRRAFSLVELIVVVSLMVLIMGWVAWSTRKDQRSAAVKGAAEELASVLRDVHQRALREHVSYGVAFNIQNAPGSSGRVLNNRTGGHFYRVIGPAKRTRYPYGHIVDNIPWGQGWLHINGHVPPGGGWRIANFPDFVDDVARSWISEPYVLPARKVRFLAVGDLDEGPRRVHLSSSRPEQVWYGSNGHTTYPRPWFGYFDPAAKRLYPWGGYDPAIPESGFFYQGDDGAITDSCNPTDRTVDHDWDARDVPDPQTGTVQHGDVDRNGDGDTDDPYEREIGWHIWKQGDPRPLVNADWLDACLLFQPNGEVEFAEWNRARRSYSETQPGAVHSSIYWKTLSGIPSRAKSRDTGVPEPFTKPYGGVGTTEVSHFHRHTGSFRITLGPDAVTDQDTFADEYEAVASFTPAWVVSISTFGVVSVSPVQTRRGYLKSLPSASLWPSDPNDWLDTRDRNDANHVGRNCRVGWLHLPQPWWQGPDAMQPTGEPILQVLDPMQLSRRIWWRQ